MARWLIASVCASFVMTHSLPASAQDPARVFGFILDQAAREIDRQQYREQERRQRQFQQQMHQQFLGSWNACFQGDVAACDQALTYPNLSASNRARLLDHRSQILAARQEAAALAERRRIEAAFQERQRQFEEAQRRERERELERQREEAERLRRVREAEERREADMRAYTKLRDACRRHDMNACDRAIQSGHANTDFAELWKARDIAQRYQEEREKCQGGTLAACDLALASPAMTPGDRGLLTEWRAAASPWYASLAPVTGVLAAVRDLPMSTHIVGGIAFALAFVLLGVAYRRRGTESEPQPDAAATEAPPTETKATDPEKPDAKPTIVEGLRQRAEGLLQSLAKLTAQKSPKSDDEPAQAAPEPTAPLERDTAAALAAMELAHAYIIEIAGSRPPAHDDRVGRRHHLNTLSLAAKQLDQAQASDPDAILEVTNDSGEFRFSIAELKAQALLLEGLTHQVYDTKRAVPALKRATELDPTNASAFHALGLVQAANMNKAAAIEAYEKAVALDPTNLEYRKELNRAQNLTAAEIAAYKATRVGERVYDTGIATARVGIFAWNAFAITYNVVTWPFRMVLRVMLFLTRPV